MISFAGHNRVYTVPKALVAASVAPEGGQATAWELLKLAGAPRITEDERVVGQWADKVLDGIIADAELTMRAVLDCDDCEDVGFYALEDPDNPDILHTLLRRTDSGYDRLTATGWVGEDVAEGTPARLLTHELAGELAAVIGTGGDALVLRYVQPLAWLPPTNDTVVITLTAAVDTSGKQEGWINYAIVDDLDLGAVLHLIRLAKGPKLESFSAAGWESDNGLLSDLRGVDPPTLVELDDKTYADVLEQVKMSTAEAVAEKAKKEKGKATAVVAADVSTAERKKLADKGYALSPEGSYPIRNRDDLSNAVHAFGRAKPEDKERVKRHIIKRARALNAISALPESWGITAAGKAPGLHKDGTAPMCSFCKNTATGYVLHAEGMAYIPFCGKHKDDAVRAGEASTPDGTRDATNIDLIGEYPASISAAVSPDPRAEKLRRYWSIGGKGGLKIRWGTRGDWRRCVRHLSKYLGPRAKGYCQNMHKRNTGIYTGSRLNASATWPVVSPEESLSSALVAGLWFGTNGKVTDMKDGIYTEVFDSGDGLLEAVVAGGFPVAPPDEWFKNPELSGPQPLTVDPSGQVYGHIATFDVAHIGMPGKVHAPRSKSNYAYFKTGELLTASGGKVAVGNLTLAGGHAPLNADAGGAVAHYDNTASAIADVNIGEDRYGIWIAGALRPEATAEQIRALRASAPSGDWRPINGSLELVAVCQVNVPGFPIARARVASGAVMALVAAGARPLAEQRFAAQADEALSRRLSMMEAALIASGLMTVELETETDPSADPEIESTELTEEFPEVILTALDPTAPTEPTVVPSTEPVEQEEEGASVDITPAQHERIADLRAELAARKRREELRARVRRPEASAASASSSSS